MTEKEKMDLSLKEFYEAGVLREIYANENFSICNASNSCYILFEYALANKRPEPYGFSLLASELKSILENQEKFYEWIIETKEEEFGKKIVKCNSKTLEIMKLQKQKTDIAGALVNLEYEQALIEKYSEQKNR